MLTLFVLKNVPVHPRLNSAAPSRLPSNGVKHTHAQCFSSQGSKSYNVWRSTQGERGKGGGWIFAQFGPYFSAFWKKETLGHFLTQKESACQISADSEQLENSLQKRYIRPPFHGVLQLFSSTFNFHAEAKCWVRSMNIIKCQIVDTVVDTVTLLTTNMILSCTFRLIDHPYPLPLSPTPPPTHKHTHAYFPSSFHPLINSAVAPFMRAG